MDNYTHPMLCWQARSWRVGDSIYVGSERGKITSIVVYLPGTHPASPIDADMVAVEATTTAGTRWGGFYLTPDEMGGQWARQSVQDAAAECKRRADLGVDLEDLFNIVRKCERWARVEDAIDAACRCARP